MIPRRLVSSLFVVLFVCLALVHAQGVSKTGKKDGRAFYKAAKNLSKGNYRFQAHGKNQYLTFLSEDNIVELQSSGQDTWQVKQHKKSKYFTVRGDNDAKLEKCISTRWEPYGKGGGFPDAAVLWQCEVDTDTKNYGGYEPIFPPKQMWLAVPDKYTKGYYKIVSASHLYDMIPRCIAHNKIKGGTKLVECKVNTRNESLLWKLTKA
ncbi:hypothetical protein DFQ28_010747 [Apophysomyces sp. BC1034]|nr:hypothetical protein DFQ30_010439 [Apophysomyces sp. BC1015]KAG0170468.1 hypothetical protein DFQ29_009227 [Apophysomyces sp. BC1021]KAG0184674.1 hypothetical protein DFQ28_010747 [Apophysomyces sp. BC1034]